MEGRQFKWCLFGGLLLASIGCHRSSTTYPDTMLPKPGQSGGLLGSKPAPTAVPSDGMMVSAPRKKGPLSAEWEVAMAETHLQVAMTDPPPPNRDELIDMARARYQRALKQEPKNKGALLGIARMYAKMGDKDRAAEAFAKYLKIYPKDAEAWHEVAMKRAQLKDWPGAMAACETALKLDPENRAYRKTMGFCLARAGKYDEAFASLSKIMPEAQARHNLAGILDHMGQAEACRQQLQLALQADPGYSAAKEFLNELNEGANPIQQAGYNQPQ